MFRTLQFLGDRIKNEELGVLSGTAGGGSEVHTKLH
jgi:hypothetical protein